MTTDWLLRNLCYVTTTSMNYHFCLLMNALHTDTVRNSTRHTLTTRISTLVWIYYAVYLCNLNINNWHMAWKWSRYLSRDGSTDWSRCTDGCPQRGSARPRRPRLGAPRPPLNIGVINKFVRHKRVVEFCTATCRGIQRANSRLSPEAIFHGTLNTVTLNHIILQ